MELDISCGKPNQAFRRFPKNIMHTVKRHNRIYTASVTTLENPLGGFIHNVKVDACNDGRVIKIDAPEQEFDINWLVNHGFEIIAKPVLSIVPKFNQEKLSEISNHLMGSVYFLGEKDGARKLAAIEKAFAELLANKSIRFDGKKLTFISRHSNKQRTVTKFGCHSSCDCKGETSYHSVLFEILERYYGSVKPAYGNRELKAA